MHLTTARKEDGLELHLLGDWRARDLPDIEQALQGVDGTSVRRIVVSTEKLGVLDLAGAWALENSMERLRAGGAEVAFADKPPEPLRLVQESLEAARKEDAAAPPVSKPSLIAVLGRKTVNQYRDVLGTLDFFGRTSVMAVRAAASWRRLRPISIARHVYDTGITAIPIVSLIAFLISVIIAYMSAQQLRDLGAEVYVVDLVTIGVLRELGVLLTAIIVAGRSGSAFAAEIGAMKLNEEVDALTATGVEPIEVLVLPRIIGLVIALPLLTIIADGVGLAGGALLCQVLLDMPLVQYIARVQDAIGPTTFWVGVMKAPVFALLIALAGTYRGLQVRDSSRELGRLTTVAVVQSIFLVILADALFAVFFMQIDI